MSMTYDGSSYPKPTEGKSVLDQIQQMNTIEQQQINIDRNKLELAIKNQDNLLATLNALPKDAGPDEMRKWGQSAVKAKLVDPRMYAEFVTNMPAPTGDPAKDREALTRYRQTVEQRAMGTSEAMKWKYGQQFDRDSGQSVTPMRGDLRTGVETPTSNPIAKQISVNQPVIGPDNKIVPYGQRGDQIPQGALPAPGAPGSYIDPGMNNRGAPGLRSAVQPNLPGPITNPAIPGKSSNFGNVIGATVENLPPANFNERFGAKGPTVLGREPGAAEAEVATGAQSGQQLAQARNRAANYTQEMFPVTQAIEAARNLGTKGTGPGTESINQVKSFILSNIPNIKESDPKFDTIKDFDKLNKYLVQIAQGTGFGADTNDKLAAAFAGNPSVKISNAATQDVLGSIAALKTLDLARIKAWEKSNLQDNQYSKWAANWHNNIDPRAFAIPYMSPEAIVKLDKTLKGKERERFQNSRDIFKSLGI